MLQFIFVWKRKFITVELIAQLVIVVKQNMASIINMTINTLNADFKHFQITHWINGKMMDIAHRSFVIGKALFYFIPTALSVSCIIEFK